MPTDAEIARSYTPRPLTEIAARLGVGEAHLQPYGHDKAKVSLDLLDAPRHSEAPGRLILVSAMLVAVSRAPPQPTWSARAALAPPSIARWQRRSAA